MLLEGKRKERMREEREWKKGKKEKKNLAEREVGWNDGIQKWSKKLTPKGKII